MRDDSFREQFEKVTQETADNRRNRMLARVMETLRDAVQDMQDNGLGVTVEFRLRDSCAPMHISQEERRQTSANGSIRFGEGGPALEFILQQQYADTMYFKAYIGTQEVISQYAYGEDMLQMKQGMLAGLMRVQAEYDMVAKFNLSDRNGKTAMIGKTVLPKHPKSQ